MKYINLRGKSKGQRALVDNELYDQLNNIKWYLDSDGYVISTGNPKFKLHRVVIGAKKGEIVDHINRNKKDNRKVNLRIVDHKTNANNKKILKYVGIRKNTRYKLKKPWEAYIHINSKYKSLGCFATRKEAFEFRKKFLENR